MDSEMKRFLEKRLKIYAAELPSFTWLLIIFFVIFFFTAIFRNYTDTAFLKRFGPEHIPLMLIINSIVTFAVFAVATRLGQRFVDYTILSGFMVFYAGSTIGLFFAVKAGIDLAYPALYQLLQLLDSILLLYLWNMAGDLFDARQGKRLFPLVTASQVLATSLGNFASKPVVSILGPDPSLIIFGVTCAGLAFYLMTTGHKFLGDSQVKAAKAKAKPKYSIKDVPAMIKEYPIIRFLIIVGMMPSLLLPIFNYQFSIIANNTFTNEADLITFLGIFRGGMTLITFLLLFVIGRLYSKFGLANSSLIFPINFTIIYALLTFFFNIYVAAAGQLMTRLIQRSVHGPVSKILYSVIPGELMQWSRNFIRGTVVKIGMLIGATLMIVLKPLIDAQYLAPIAAVFAFYWMVEAIIFGRRYRRSLKQVILERRIDFDQVESVRSLDHEGLGISSTETGQIEDREDRALAEVDCNQMKPDLALAQLGDTHALTRAEAAASFACNQDPRAVTRLVAMLNDEEVVRKAAVSALMTYRESILPFLEENLTEAPIRVQRGILEVIRLSGSAGFEMNPFIGRRMQTAYTNLIAIRRFEGEEQTPALQMLTAHLWEKNDEILSLVFHALWVSHPDMRLMYEALHSKDASIAVEMVEATLSKTLAPHLIPLIEDVPLKEKISQGRKTFSLIKSDDMERVLTLLAHDPDPTTRLTAMLVIGEIVPGSIVFRPTIDTLLEDPVPEVAQVAQYAYQRCVNEEAAMPDVIEKITKLKSFSIFDEMGIRELQAIASISTLETFSQGDVLIREGEESGTIFLIVRGTLDVISGYQTADQVVKASIGEGTFVGELSLFTQGMPNASCIANAELEALVIRHHQFQEIMKIYPQIGINMCSFLAAKLRTVTY